MSGIDDRLSLTITHPDGSTDRWGPDEPDGKDVPTDLSITDAIPGGHEQLSTSLLRRIDLQYPDEVLFDDVHCYGAGNRTAWRGMMKQFPRSHGDGFGVSPGAVGYSAILRYDPSYRQLWVDRSFQRWQEATLSRRINLAIGGTSQGKIPVAIGGDGISWAPPNEALPAGEETDVFYDSGPGQKIIAIQYVGNVNGAFTSFEAPTVWSAPASTGGYSAAALTLNGLLQVATSFTDDRWLMMRCRTSGAVTPAAGHLRSFTKMAVYGLTGVAPTQVPNDTDGFLASDVVAHAVSNAAPLLNFTTGQGGSIESAAFAIQHLVFADPVTAEDVISAVNVYHLYDWGVYDNREFFYRSPNPDRMLWEARLSDGAILDADGDDGEQVINGVFVSYTNELGEPKTVGPPGGSFDATDTALEDTSSTNPVNAHGIPRKWVGLSLSYPTTQAGATQIGYAYLQERSLAGRRGTLRLKGTATHPTEGKVPCWRIRAGDWVTVKDLNGNTVPRKIIRKSYTHATREVSLELDNTVAKLDAILARVGIQTGIMTGGGF